MTFGHRTAQIRIKKGMSQLELGEKVGKAKDMISRYERDATLPSIDVAGKIARALETSLDDLVFGFKDSSSPRDFAGMLKEIEALTDEDRDHVLAVINAFITKSKLEKILK